MYEIDDENIPHKRDKIFRGVLNPRNPPTQEQYRGSEESVENCQKNVQKIEKSGYEVKILKVTKPKKRAKA